MNNIRHFILATAGHVDHGKSALVKALTGTDPDRLPEEKARGITIDLGFAHLELPAPPQEPGGRGQESEVRNQESGVSPQPSVPSPQPSTASLRSSVLIPSTLTLNPQPSTLFHLGIVDVPGHEDFVKNMVAGVGSIDLALFIVAADDSWMPQTEEHLQILTYLGVTRAVVALTKIDLAESMEAEVMEDVHEHLRGSPFAGAPIVPTSVLTGRGLEELKAALARVLADTPPPRDIGKPRLPVDRAFVLRGIGTVVTGTLIGGSLNRGQPVIIQPKGIITRIRSLQTHNQEVTTSPPGTRTALNLPDVEVEDQSSTGRNSVRRGDVITVAELGNASDTVDVLLEKSPRKQSEKSGAARPLKDGTLVRIHHGSGNVPAKVALLDREPLTTGQRALAQLRLEAPVFALAGDRFIVRDWSEQWTLAGGLVLDAEASRKNFRTLAQRKFLQERAQSVDQIQVWVRSQLARDGAVKRPGVLPKSRFSAKEITDAVTQLQVRGLAVVSDDCVAEATWWRALRQRATDAIGSAHQRHPQHVGMPLNDLRAAIAGDAPAAMVFDAVIRELCQGEFRQAGTVIRRATHRPALTPQLQAAGNRLRAMLTAKPFEPPSRKELSADAAAQQALRFLLETGEAVEVGGEVVMLSDHFARATEVIKAVLSERGPATVSELRQALGTSRRVIVPLLERLDRDGVTSRVGDQRVLKQRG